MKKPPQKVAYLWQLGVFFSAAPTAQNSPELHFRFINSFIQLSLLRSLVKIFRRHGLMCNEQPELLDENEEAVGDKVPNVIVWYGSRNQPMYSHRLDSCKSKKKGNVFTHFYMHSAVHLSFYCYTNLVLVRGLNQLPRLSVGESKNKSSKKQVFLSKGEITRLNSCSVYTLKK